MRCSSFQEKGSAVTRSRRRCIGNMARAPPTHARSRVKVSSAGRSIEASSFVVIQCHVVPTAPHAPLQLHAEASSLQVDRHRRKVTDIRTG